MNLRLTFLAMLFICLSQPCWSAEQNQLMTGAAEAFKNGKYTEAIGLLGEAKQKEFENPVWHYYMANSLFRLNQRERAIKEYKMAMDLAPEGQLKQYCQSALDSLAPPSVSKGSAKGQPITTKLQQPDMHVPLVASQQPQVISVLCGCPLCKKLELPLMNLETKYGNRIKFKRTMMEAPGSKVHVEVDENVRDILEKYSVTKCPTVMVFDSQGSMQNVYSNDIPVSDLVKVVEDLAKTSPKEQVGALHSAGLDSYRQTIADDLNSKISHDQLRLDKEIKDVESDANEQIDQVRNQTYTYGSSRTGSVVYGASSADMQEQIDQIQADTKNKIKALRDDFERRKQDWNNAAQTKIKALESSQSSK